MPRGGLVAPVASTTPNSAAGCSARPKVVGDAVRNRFTSTHDGHSATTAAASVGSKTTVTGPKAAPAKATVAPCTVGTVLAAIHHSPVPRYTQRATPMTRRGRRHTAPVNASTSSGNKNSPATSLSLPVTIPGPTPFHQWSFQTSAASATSDAG